MLTKPSGSTTLGPLLRGDPTQTAESGIWILTRMEGVAGDLGSPQPLGEFVGEEDVAQFAVTVDLQHPCEGGGQSQSFVLVQVVKIDIPKVVAHRCDVHDPAGSPLLQPVQQQVGQQEVAHMVDTKHHSQAVLRAALHEHTWDGSTGDLSSS